MLRPPQVFALPGELHLIGVDETTGIESQAPPPTSTVAPGRKLVPVRVRCGTALLTATGGATLVTVGASNLLGAIISDK